MSARRPRVTVIAEGAIPTGFARVAESVFSRLADRYEVRQLTPHPLPADRPPDVPPWPIAPIPRADEPRGEERMVAAVRAQRPDVVWILADVQIAREYARLLHPLRADGVRLVAYCPIDLTPLPPDMVEPLEHLDDLVAYTRYGADALAAAFRHVAAARPGFRPPVPRDIPHGVDTRVFHRMDRARARAELLGEDALPADAFIVLNANRNQPRKRIDLTLEAFARFAQGKPPSVMLHLHMGLRDRGWDVRALAERHGIGERIIWSTEHDGMPYLDDATLNLVYNAADVGVSTAVTEGWGLVPFEHAATGAAQVLPGHSVFAELWEGAAVLVPPALTLVTPEGAFEEHYVSAASVAGALERLYGDPAFRAEMSAAAYANATRPRYGWDDVAARWDALLSGAPGA